MPGTETAEKPTEVPEKTEVEALKEKVAEGIPNTDEMCFIFYFQKPKKLKQHQKPKMELRKMEPIKTAKMRKKLKKVKGHCLYLGKYMFY